MKSPKLRAYQRTVIESARRALTKSDSCILQMPTGAGKTRAATEIVATSRGVIWFVCHRQEIERQVAKAFTAAGIDFGIVSPRGELQPKKRVQIVSVHTLRKRLRKLPAPKLVIWDECHHVAAKSWASIRAKLKDARHLGLTATPERLDGKGLGEWFAELVTGPGIAELIKKDFLSEFRYFAPSDPDLTNAKLQAGDYKKADIGKIMNTPVLIGDAVREYKKNAKSKRALAFCASVAASKALTARFRKDGIKAAHVDGTTPTAERDVAIADLAAGRIKVLCNVEVFTEGFDLPAIDAVILMRPTKSPTLLLQMIGRGLRKAPGKDGAIILDHAGLHADHGDFSGDWPWSLDGGAVKARRAAMARGPRRCPECKEVRFERVETCSCGYEFPTGREIGEFDGVLTEVRGVVPEGRVTQGAFAKMCNVSQSAISLWVKDGLPSDSLGRIYVDPGIIWVANNKKCRLAVTTGFETSGEAAKRLGLCRRTITNAAKLGRITRHESGLFKIADVNKWNEEFNTTNDRLPPRDVSDPESYLSARAFAVEVGASESAVRRWKSLGMPHSSNGWVHRERAMEWLPTGATYWQNKPYGTPEEEYEYKKSFAKRLGVDVNTITTWSKRGLPCASNGWVHIQRGLEWVRDNTDIKIPASALPKKAAKVKRSKPRDEYRASA